MVIHLPKLEKAVELWVDHWFTTWETLAAQLIRAASSQFELRVIGRLFAQSGGNPLQFVGMWAARLVAQVAAAFDNFAEASLVGPIRILSKLAVESLDASETKQRVLTAYDCEKVIIELLRELADKVVTGDLPIELRMAYYIRGRAKWVEFLATIIRRTALPAVWAQILAKLFEALVLRTIRITVAFSVGIMLILFCFILRDKLRPGDPGNLISQKLLFNKHPRKTEAEVIRRRVGGAKP